ncbi:MAG: 50S ribosomal protein L9 [Candidatus Moranbacteria bacterium]|nr:50S ribosomal protein L9 [Candidatus Moranbacteria bacterium]
MKIILLQNVKGFGNKGDVKEVSEGYARNFLLPKKLAAIATKEAVVQAETKKKREAEEQKLHDDLIRKEADKLKGEKVEIGSKGKDGKLFGSVGAKDIIAKLKEKGFEIKEKDLMLKSPIRKAGEYSVEVVFGPKIKSEIKVIITEEK